MWEMWKFKKTVQQNTQWVMQCISCCTLRCTIKALDECLDSGWGLWRGGGTPAETHPLSESSQVPLHCIHVVVHSASLLILPRKHTELHSACILRAPVLSISTLLIESVKQQFTIIWVIAVSIKNVLFIPLPVKANFQMWDLSKLNECKAYNWSFRNKIK